MPSEIDALAAARAGDENAFQSLVSPLRPGLLAHCYRMSGSVQDAEDFVQEAMLKAWKGLGAFEQRSSFQTWMYRVATHATIDALRKSKVRALPVDTHPPADPTRPPGKPIAEPVWLEPFPDALLPASLPGTDARLSARQSVGFAFLQMLQQLPPMQRAAVLLKDVVGFSGPEIAECLETTPAAVNSLVQRARDKLSTAPEPTTPNEVETSILDRYIAAWEKADVDQLVTLLSEDAGLSMPPIPSWYHGAASCGAWLKRFVLPSDATGKFEAVVTRANGLPAVAVFERGEPRVLTGVQVLRIEEGRIREVVAFMDPRSLTAFGLS